MLTPPPLPSSPAPTVWRTGRAGPTDVIFNNPADPRTADYVNGRFG